MRKNLIITVIATLIFTHIIPPYNTSFASEEVTECENMNFTVQTIVENDKKIVGTALPSDQLNIEFKTKNITEPINVSSNGKFELAIEAGFLEANDIVTISNEYFIVETKVASEGTAEQSVQSSKYVECPVLIEEESEPEEIPEEAVSEEEASEPEETMEETASEEEVSEPEETPEEAASEEEVSEPEEAREETTNEELSDMELSKIEDVASDSRDNSELLIKEFELLIDDIAKYESNNIVPFASLTEVQLLTDVMINANLTEPAEGESYNLNLNLSGTGLTDVELVSPDRVVVFYAPDLADQLEHNGGTAAVEIDILPLTMNDLPALNTALEGLQGTLTGLVTGLLTGIDAALPAIIPSWLVEVNGIDGLNVAIDNLNNLNTALADVLSYNGNLQYTVNADGTVVVNFSDGLGNHLETAVIDIVQSALNDLNTAVNNLEINILSGLPIVGDLLNSLTNDLLLPLVGNVTSLVTDFSTNLTNGTINLTNDLASANVIGNTNVNLDVLVSNPPGEVGGTIPVFGAGIQDSAIDLMLLNSLQSQTTVTFPEPPRFVLTQPEDIVFDTTEINNREELIYRQNNEYSIEVIDERPNSNWTLSVQAIEPLRTLDEMHTLSNSLFYFEDGNEPKSIENGMVEIAQKDQNDTSGIQNIIWSREEGLLLNLNPINAVADEEYSTTIEWTLTDGP